MSASWRASVLALAGATLAAQAQPAPAAGRFSATAATAESAAPRRDDSLPNVLLVVADDLGPEFVACYGLGADPPVTPVLDRLAANGIRFDRAYADPVCSPSRACLQTGRHAFRSGVLRALAPGQPGLRDEELLLPEALAGSGYARALIGKWHLGVLHGQRTPNMQGWPHFVGGLDGSVRSYTNWLKVRNGEVTTCSHYVTSDEVDEALAWVRAQQRPWLLHLCFHAPHSPFHAPPAGLHRQDLAGRDPAKDPVPFYKAMVEALDHELGRLLQGLGPSLADTNVIFVGDNGAPEQTAPPWVGGTRAKGSLYEDGCRVPCIVSGPAVAGRGRTCAAPIHVVDLFPTVLELCGVDPAAAFPDVALDGVSLLPLLRSEPGWSRPPVYVEIEGTTYGMGCALLRDDYKLIRFYDHRFVPAHEALYDLAVDSHEAVDLLACAPGGPAARVRDGFDEELWRMRRRGHVLVAGAGCQRTSPALRPLTLMPPRVGTKLPVTLRTPDGAPVTGPTALLCTWRWGLEDRLGGLLPNSDGAVLFACRTSWAFTLWIPGAPALRRAAFEMQGFLLDPSGPASGRASAVSRVVLGE
jgi:arylsulfatase A-like enzyme